MFDAAVSTNWRKNFDRYLRDYAIALRTDPEKAGAASRRPRSTCWNGPTCGSWFVWTLGLLEEGNSVRSRRPNPTCVRTVESLTMQIGTALRDDPALQSKVDGEPAAPGQPRARPSTPTTSPSSSPETVARWDAADTGRRLELQVGRDLQFIRINGTVVGALVGVIIYAVSQVL